MLKHVWGKPCRNLRKTLILAGVLAFDDVWKSCQNIELVTDKMCAAKGSIYAALLTSILVVMESFVRPLGGL